MRKRGGSGGVWSPASAPKSTSESRGRGVEGYEEDGFTGGVGERFSWGYFEAILTTRCHSRRQSALVTVWLQYLLGQR